MPQNYNKDLADIISLLLEEPDRNPENIIPDEDYLKTVITEVISLDCNNAGKKINELREDIERTDNRYGQLQPYFLIFISYAYSLLSLGADSLHFAQRAYPFKWNNDWRQAMSYWFLGLVYLQNNYVEEARNELTSAQRKLDVYCGIAKDKYERVKKCKILIDKVKGILNSLPPRQPHVRPPTQVDVPVQAEAGAKQENKSESQPPVNISIHIPVDIRATDSFEQSSDRDHIDWTRPVKKEEPIPADDEVPAETAENISGIVDQSYIFTPSIPLYGTALLGPDGIAVLDDPDYTAVVDEIPLIRFSNIDHNLFSLREGDHQISISNNDFLTSILNPQITKKLGLDGKKYGWLKVEGNSMSKSSPIPINNGDYVLFNELRNKAACIDKIVVASMPIGEAHASRLFVKKLVKLSNAYFFHSDSLFDIDPDTGVDYRKDIEVTGEHQLIGIVLAVAKPN